MQIKLFPYILSRVGGLPIDWMNSISWSSENQLEEYFRTAELIEEERQDILEGLLEVVEVIDDYPAKFYLKILRRDIYNRRSIKIKPFQYTGQVEVAFHAIIERVKTFKTNLQQWQVTQASFGDFYQKELSRARVILQQTELPEALTKGLQLASHSFLNRLGSYQKKGPLGMNKKLFQTERKLIQYLSRIATKTSPFSSFTQLAVIDFDYKIAGEYQRKVRLNNSLFRLFRDVLIHYPPFFKHLKVRLNPSYRKESVEDSADQNGVWVFLLNTRNIESVQRLDDSDLVTFIVESLQADGADYTLLSFIAMLAENVEANPLDLENYIRQLIDYGFIEWDWSFSGLDSQWFIQLRKSLKKYQHDHLLKTLYQVLNDLESWIDDFETGNLEQRILAQQKAFEELKNIANKLLDASALRDLEQIATSDHLKNIVSSKFQLIKEQVFYEDVSQVAQTNFSRTDFESCGAELHHLTQLISHLYYNPEKEKYLAFFKANYKNEKVSLLEFYEAFFRNHLHQPSVIDEEESNRRRAYFQELIDKGQHVNADHFHLDLDVIPELEKEQIDEHRSKGALFQLFKTDDGVKAFVETAFMGYGKMFGRFLHLFPEELTQAIQDRNAALNTDSLWVENVDASIYNPNVHPPLLSLEIQMPGSQNNLPKDHQIPVGDLVIYLDKSSDSLKLWHKTLNKRVIVFDYGFEAIDNRSPMYRLLATFNYRMVGPDILTDLLDNKLVQKDKEGIIHRPRITVGQHLVIRRRGWGIPLTLLPMRADAINDANYFLKVNQWRSQLNIPQKVFITIDSLDFHTDRKQRRRSDAYKPQYIDFASPLMIQLFAKLIVKTPEFLKIEEMLPADRFGENVQEFLLETSSVL